MQRLVLRAHLRLGLDPLGLALDRRLRIAHLQAQQLAALRAAGRRCRPARPAHAHAATSAYSEANTVLTVSTRSRGATRAPTISLTVVTPASAIPHGMMPRKPTSVLSQLIAKPCIVTPRSTR